MPHPGRAAFRIGGCRSLDHARRSRRDAGRRRFLQGQDDRDPDGDRAGRQLRSLRPHHRRAPRPAHSRQPDHHHRAHARRRRRHRRQPHLQHRAAGRQRRFCSPTPCRWWRSCSRATMSASTRANSNGSAPMTPSRRPWRCGTRRRPRRIDELKTRELVIGSFNNTHLTYQWAMLLKNVLNANYKVITGYRGGNDLNLAMERGEIHGWTVSCENLVGTRPQWLAEKKINLARAVHARASGRTSRTSRRSSSLPRPTSRTWRSSSPPARRSRAPWRWGRACPPTASLRCARRSTRS